MNTGHTISSILSEIEKLDNSIVPAKEVAKSNSVCGIIEDQKKRRLFAVKVLLEDSVFQRSAIRFLTEEYSHDANLEMNPLSIREITKIINTLKDETVEKIYTIVMDESLKKVKFGFADIEAEFKLQKKKDNEVADNISFVLWNIKLGLDMIFDSLRSKIDEKTVRMHSELIERMIRTSENSPIFDENDLEFDEYDPELDIEGEFILNEHGGYDFIPTAQSPEMTSEDIWKAIEGSGTPQSFKNLKNPDRREKQEELTHDEDEDKFGLFGDYKA